MIASRGSGGLLSIATVAFESATLLGLGRDLLLALNEGAAPRWIVAENSPAESAERLALGDIRFEVLPGVPRQAWPEARAASFHHARGLATLVPRITTRFLLVLDPDFYLVHPGWVEAVPAHMDRLGLAFFGVPWHPKWLAKPRYFPGPHCLFVDLDRVARDTLDFTPADEVSDLPATAALKRVVPGPLRRAASGLLLRPRAFIGRSRDTGYRLHCRYAADPATPSECATPVFRPAADWPWWRGIAGLAARAGDGILPDRLRYVPGRAGYFASRGFRDLGFPDAAAEGWEEFLWRGRPFGFHLRRFRQDRRPAAEEARALRRVLEGVRQEALSGSR